MFLKKKAQSTLEYALLISVVVAALIAVNLYMKKGVMGKLKESSDDIGQQFDPENGYSVSWKTSSEGTTETEEERAVGGQTTTKMSSGEKVTRNEHEVYGGEKEQPDHPTYPTF